MALLTLVSCAVAWHARAPLAPHGLRPAARMVLQEPSLTQMQAAATVVPTPPPKGSEPIKRYKTTEWLLALRTVRKSIVWKRIKHRVKLQTGLATLVVAARALGLQPALPALVHTMLGGFLGLLLVFRTNAAYARFWEGRCLWGLVNNNCRNVAIATVAYVRPASAHAAKDLSDALLDYPAALLAVCDERPRANLEVAGVCLRMHQALAAASEARQGNLTMFEQLQLSQTADVVNKLIDNALGCARIVNTPVPRSYSRHTSRFLTVWCGTLPFVLAPMIGVMSIPASAVVCWSLFGIEELGHLIEQPFEENEASIYDVGIPAWRIARDIRAGIQNVIEE